MSAEGESTIARIPGHLAVELGPGGEVRAWAFMPSASDAGYFGPAAIVDDGAETEWSLHVDDPAGPLWRAVRDALGRGVPIGWEE